MPIVSSFYTIDAHPQRDGARYVQERHTDSAGVIHRATYRLPAGQGDAEAQANMEARVPKIEARLAVAEFAGVLNRLAPANTLVHQTAAEFAARFWEALREAHRDDRVQFARMIWWLYNRVQAGDFTQNQVRLSFNAAYGRNLDSTQWTTLVTTRLAPIRDRYQAMVDEADL